MFENGIHPFTKIVGIICLALFGLSMAGVLVIGLLQSEGILHFSPLLTLSPLLAFMGLILLAIIVDVLVIIFDMLMNGTEDYKRLFVKEQEDNVFQSDSAMSDVEYIDHYLTYE